MRVLLVCLYFTLLSVSNISLPCYAKGGRYLEAGRTKIKANSRGEEGEVC